MLVFVLKRLYLITKYSFLSKNSAIAKILDATFPRAPTGKTMSHERNHIAGTFRIARIDTIRKSGLKYARIDSFELDEEFVIDHA